MKKCLLAVSSKVCLLYLSFSLSAGAMEFGYTKPKKFSISSEVTPNPKKRGSILLNSLYCQKTGAQREYLEDINHIDNEWLAVYGRVWVYSQGIALARASRTGNFEEAEKMAHWLDQNAVRGSLNGESYIAGWNFSKNTMKGDSWADVRLVTGANAWVVQGLGVYIASPVFDGLSKKEKIKYKNLYKVALRGLAEHQREDGLVTAGWTCEELLNAPRGSEYYDRLDDLGYKSKIERVKAKNVVTEHNLDMLSLWNHAIKNHEKLGLENGQEITQRRNRLRKAIFSKLYDKKKERIITGLVSTNEGEQASPHTAIDNASWLGLSVNYNEISDDEIEKLSKALSFTIQNFVKKIDCKGKAYLGSHYFRNKFEDPYIEKSSLQEIAYNLEATAGLILGLNYFCDANPYHGKSLEFRKTADLLWSEMQSFVQANGFPYATKCIKYIFTDLQSATASIWYLDIYDYYNEFYEIDTGEANREVIEESESKVGIGAS